MKVLDLFSGIGGFSLGLERAGMTTVAFCEIDPFCRKVLRKHWPDVPIYEDVRTLDYDGPVDVISTGDPCQRDSRANASRDGASMWPHALRQIRKHRPLFVLRENVLGNIDTGTLRQVERDLGEDGYRCRTYIIPISSVGGATDRPRTWTLAYSDSAGQEKFHNAAKPVQTQGWKHTMHVGENGLYWVGTEPPVLRRIDDVPHRVDRIGSLGNSATPIIPEIFGRAIMEMAA